MNVRLHFLFTLLTASLIPQTGGAQELSTDVRQKIGKTEIYQGVQALLPAELSKYNLQIRTNKRSIEELIPQALRSKKDKRAKTFNPAGTKPLVTALSTPYTPTNGLKNRHIALWQSHGFYYEPKLTRWEWQRWKIYIRKVMYCLSWFPCWRMQELMC